MKLRYEFWKLRKYKAFMVILCLLCCFKVFELTQTKTAYLFSNPNSEKYYQEYIDRYQGHLSKDDIKRINQEKNQFNICEQKRIEISNQLITYHVNANQVSQLKKEMNDALSYLDKQEAFTYFYDQVQYVQENQKDFIIFDSRGWQAMIEDEYVDIILIIILMIVNSLVFVVEYEEETYPVMISTIRGRKGVFLTKIKLSLIISTIFIFIFLISHDLFYLINGSFEHSTAYMQNIALFKHAPYHISLYIAVIVERIIRILGYYSIVVLTWILTIVFKRFVIAFFVQGGFYVLLTLLVSHKLLYIIPNPLSFILSSGYIRGQEFRLLNKHSENEMAIQTFFACRHIILWMGLIIFIGILLIGLRKFYLNYTHQQRKLRNKLMILVLLGCCLVGCQDSTVAVETGYKNRNYIESNGQIVYSHMDSLVTLDSKLQIEKYIKDPTYTDDGYISDFYMNDQYTYFWVYKQEGYQIYKYDESKRRVKLFYNHDTHLQSSLLYSYQEDYSFIDAPIIDNSARQFYIDDHYIYYATDKYVYKEDMNPQQTSMIFSLANGSVLFTEGHIYFINNNLDLCDFDIKNQKTKIISNDLIYQFKSSYQNIYYSKAKDKGIYCFDGNKEVKILDDVYEMYEVSGDLLYLKEDKGVLIYNTATHKEKHIKDRIIYTIQVLNEKEIIYTEEKGSHVNIVKADNDFENSVLLIQE